MEKKSKILWTVLGIGAFIIIILILLSSILSIGDRLSKIHKYLEYSFYVLSGILFFFVIINPIRIILFSPSFEIVSSLDPNSHKMVRVLKKVSKNMIRNNHLSKEAVYKLKHYKNGYELRENLTFVFDSEIKGTINEIIIRNAKTVLISTAISQNPRVDLIASFTVNLRMIKLIVQKCGYRPSMKNLGKLSVNVATTALIADGLESLSLDDVLPNSAVSTLGEIPFLKPALASVTQGITNALLTIRIGMVTRKYLFQDGNEITKEDIRRSAVKESLKLVPKIVNDTISFVPKKILSVFKRKKTTSEDDNDTVVEGAK